MKKSVQTITYASAEARETVLQSPMAGGMENSYRALDALLAEPM
jgi:hypothetical protein